MTNRFIKNVLISVMTLSSFVLNMSYAENPTGKSSTPKLDCLLTDQMSADKKPGDPKDTFDTTTPAFYAVCTTKDLHKGQSLTAQWIAADTHKATPENYKIQEKTARVPDALQEGQALTFDFSLAKTTKDWPAGRYHVDFYIDKQKDSVQSIDFMVSANKTTE